MEVNKSRNCMMIRLGRWLLIAFFFKFGLKFVELSELKFDSLLHPAQGSQIFSLHDAAGSQILPLHFAAGN
jgi:hypothetical protein